MQAQLLIDEHAKGKGRLKREATETALIGAFVRVVRRNGLRNIGVNAVISEAGVGKALLYRYFGGLPGLVEAWGNRNDIWPGVSEFRSMAANLDTEDVAGLLKCLLHHYADGLRNDPIRIEILAEQFMQPSAISEPLQKIRREAMAEYDALFKLYPVLERHAEILQPLAAAVSYMAMRATRSPWYMGKNLGSKDGWANAMRQIDALVDAALV